ncbi:RnfABCDGE type electron transport complex subunit D [Geosporobacter ferrireducens]|uniref:NADH:ubiquinone oxidoreductase, Na translocating, B subunit n=1 Tax=Geosporobacter ferrireducens TaxID=1424294 RepID=A0A1D8GCF6_9FIRM|nr:RnfABCDGE type electron transport complex subunit D [Geosporobacter ferrireducens]AOT68587.1 NADH:ubiquinone oxidoreductase, Na translocating, B subunit [Geosporobacter ferrireducens]MTI54056.1 RnfABCDGE type electron transport complex subunit D [Geosporobacter ferrireducens]
MGIVYKQLFMKQKLMRKVIISLFPICLASVYFFGLRALVLMIWVIALGTLTEWFFERRNKKPISEAAIVTCMLYTLTLPPTTPFWVAGIGIIFGIIFGKEVFGGFGKNIFNPALVARCFVYVNFPTPLTMYWSKPASGFPGGFGMWLTETVDVLSQATPMLIFRDSGQTASYLSLFLGNVSGSLGETSGLLILLAAIYLIYTKSASWQTMAAVLTGYLFMSISLFFMGSATVPNPLFGLLSGGFLFGTVFMSTDPISSPMTVEGKWIYGILIGIVTVIIRGYALFAGGIMFAILIGNTFAPLIDEGIKAYKNYRKKVHA